LFEAGHRTGQRQNQRSKSTEKKQSFSPREKTRQHEYAQGKPGKTARGANAGWTKAVLGQSGLQSEAGYPKSKRIFLPWDREVNLEQTSFLFQAGNSKGGRLQTQSNSKRGGEQSCLASFGQEKRRTGQGGNWENPGGTEGGE